MNRDEIRQHNRARMPSLAAELDGTLGELMREFGEIEQEADVIAFVYRDHVYDETAPEDEAEILIQGNRHGPTGKIPMRFIASQMLWCDPDMEVPV